MFDLIAGLPVHPLVVHAAVVLAPLAALLLLAYVLRPAWRLGLRWPLVGCAVVAAGSAYVAKESGEKLEQRVGDPGTHAQWGDRAFIGSAALMVVTLAVVFLLTRAARVTVAAAPAGAGAPAAAGAPAEAAPAAAAPGRMFTPAEGGVRRMLALLLAVVTAAAVFFTMFEAGHSGATSVWKDGISKTHPSGGEGD